MTTSDGRPLPPWWDELTAKADRVYRAVMRHRERYVHAWIAATGVHPLNAMIVERHMPDGSIQITVERRL